MADFMLCTNCQDDSQMQLPMNAPDGGVIHTCLGDHRGTGPWVFTVHPAVEPTRTVRRSPARVESSGVTADLLEPLTACFEAGGPWLEFGVVEARLRERAPEVFARHVAEAGHTMFGPASNTASGRVAMALSTLRARGAVAGFVGKSTGSPWRGRTISHWCLEGSTPRTEVLSWVEDRAQRGLSEGWTDEDRAGLTAAGAPVGV
ncbi:hypothetical protein FHR75_004343 [Kineococcus radiotolerans]|uniref:Uncharacterized protein n=1 Tax=Kineococcus radiotolerans TaxID=131568 RepID=A0A7W4TQY6_KINRA|nr:hypothetical protein [Kineococcus radiotolerans]MBB2903501.1 hypothetical protein [Kineococcus radiotolerans]